MWKCSDRSVSSISVSLLAGAPTDDLSPSSTPLRVNLFVFKLAGDDDMIKAMYMYSHVQVQSPPTRAILQTVRFAGKCC